MDKLKKVQESLEKVKSLNKNIEAASNGESLLDYKELFGKGVVKVPTRSLLTKANTWNYPVGAYGELNLGQTAGSLPYSAGHYNWLHTQFPTLEVTQRVIKWYRPQTQTSTADTVIEGATKPGLPNTNVVEDTITLDKIAISAVYSEEQALADLNSFIEQDLVLRVRAGIENYVLASISATLPVLNSAPYANSIQAANLYDLYNVLSLEYFNQAKYTLEGQVLSPNAFIAPFTLVKGLKWLKDINNNYIFLDSPFDVPVYDTARLEAMLINTNDFILVFWGDSNIMIKQGYVNDQFIRNEFTVVAEVFVALIWRGNAGIISSNASVDIATISI